MRYFFAISLLLIYSYTGRSQSLSDLVMVKQLISPISDFSVDNMGNIYIISSENQLKKFSADGDSLGVYNEVRRFGKLHSIDATNPLKLVLFYRDFSTIVILDRMLNVRNTIDLRKYNIFQVKAVGLAYDNNIWVYDEQAARLKRVAEDGTIVAETNDLRQVFDSLPSPDVIADQNALVYLYDSSMGMYVFDYFGSLKNRIQIRGLTDFQVVGNSVFGRRGDKLIRYQSGTFNLEEQQLPASAGELYKIKIVGGRLYLLTAEGIAIYESPK